MLQVNDFDLSSLNGLIVTFPLGLFVKSNCINPLTEGVFGEAVNFSSSGGLVSSGYVLK
jgi:hypothetical protein